MMVVDSSAVVAIVRDEPDAADLIAMLDSADGAIMSAVSLVETNLVVIGRRLGADPQRIGLLLDSLGIATVDVTVEQAHIAVAAFLRYGKGRHPARLNIADCFTYALAKSRNLPLLFKGADFLQTDIAAARRV
ncbi:MAG: type II toxin-antitoxin system VapC family toxin [Pseudolabrys sp.]|nr:type II toxin-antitoxin system VapC family toxin [Pseudolabrys sp.]